MLRLGTSPAVSGRTPSIFNASMRLITQSRCDTTAMHRPLRTRMTRRMDKCRRGTSLSAFASTGASDARDQTRTDRHARCRLSRRRLDAHIVLSVLGRRGAYQPRTTGPGRTGVHGRCHPALLRLVDGRARDEEMYEGEPQPSQSKLQGRSGSGFTGRATLSRVLQVCLHSNCAALNLSRSQVKRGFRHAGLLAPGPLARALLAIQRDVAAP